LRAGTEPTEAPDYSLIVGVNGV